MLNHEQMISKTKFFVATDDNSLFQTHKTKSANKLSEFFAEPLFRIIIIIIITLLMRVINMKVS